MSSIFTILPHTWITLRGPDAQRFLQGQVTADVAGLAPGQVQMACLCDHKAALQAVVWIRRWEEDGVPGFLLDCPAELAETVFARLDRYLIADEVILEQLGDGAGFTLVHAVTEAGARWGGLESALGQPVREFSASRFGPAGVDGLFPASAGTVEEVREELGRAGFAGFAEATAAELDECRIASMTPAWGAELVPGVLAPEVGLGEPAISLNKGCYLGQEVFSRLKSVGRARQVLAVVEAAADAAALSVGEALFVEENPLPEAKPAGRVTTIRADGRRGLAVISRAVAASGRGLLFGAAPGAEKPLCSPRSLGQTLEPFAR